MSLKYQPASEPQAVTARNNVDRLLKRQISLYKTHRDFNTGFEPRLLSPEETNPLYCTGRNRKTGFEPRLLPPLRKPTTNERLGGPGVVSHRECASNIVGVPLPAAEREGNNLKGFTDFHTVNGSFQGQKL